MSCRLIINSAAANGVVKTDDEDSPKCLFFYFFVAFLVNKFLTQRNDLIMSISTLPM